MSARDGDCRREFRVQKGRPRKDPREKHAAFAASDPYTDAGKYSGRRGTGTGCRMPESARVMTRSGSGAGQDPERQARSPRNAHGHRHDSLQRVGAERALARLASDATLEGPAIKMHSTLAAVAPHAGRERVSGPAARRSLPASILPGPPCRDLLAPPVAPAGDRLRRSPRARRRSRATGSAGRSCAPHRARSRHGYCLPGHSVAAPRNASLEPPRSRPAPPRPAKLRASGN